MNRYILYKLIVLVGCALILLGTGSALAQDDSACQPDFGAIYGILARAQELESAELDSGVGIEPDALIEAASEVGIDPNAVRDSLAIERLLTGPVTKASAWPARVISTPRSIASRLASASGSKAMVTTPAKASAMPSARRQPSMSLKKIAARIAAKGT